MSCEKNFVIDDEDDVCRVEIVVREHDVTGDRTSSNTKQIKQILLVAFVLSLILLSISKVFLSLADRIETQSTPAVLARLCRCLVLLSDAPKASFPHGQALGSAKTELPSRMAPPQTLGSSQKSPKNHPGHSD